MANEGNVIEQLVIGLAFGKVDTSNLDKADKIAKEKAKSAEDAYKDAAKRVEQAQEAVRNASDKTAKKVASDALHAARQSAKAARAAMIEARTAAKEAEKASAAAAKKADDSAKQWSSSWKSAASGVAGALGASFAASTLVDLTREVISQSAELEQWSIRLNTSAENLQVLGNAGKLAHVPQEVLFKSIQKLNVGLGEFQRTGAGPAADALKALGLRIEDLLHLSPEEQFRKIADGLTRVGTDAERTSTLVKLIGEEGAALAPLLSQGASGLDSFTEAGRRVGGMTDEQIAKNAQLAKETEALKLRWEAFTQQLVSASIPALTTTVDRLSAIGSAIADVAPEADETTSAMDANTTAVEENSAAWDLLTTFGLGPISIGFQATTRLVDELGAALDRVSGKIPGVVAGARAQVQAQLGPRQAALAAADQAVAHSNQATMDAQIGTLNSLFEGTSLVDQQDPRANARNDRKKKGGAGNSRDARELKRLQGEVGASEFGAELRRLGEQFGAGDKAIAESIKAVASAMQRGANTAMAHKAGYSTLGGLVGQDFTSMRGKDPLLSEIFGVEGIPGVPISEIAQNRTPQVLTAQITNTFTIAMDFDVNSGGTQPGQIVPQVQQGVRDLFTELEKLSRYVSIPHER